MLTEKDFCDFETCVALKELGFAEKCMAYYDPDDNVGLLYNVGYSDSLSTVQYEDLLESNNIDDEYLIDAPTLYEAHKWLRKKKDIKLDVYSSHDGWTWEFTEPYKKGWDRVYMPNKELNPKLKDDDWYDEYEDALQDGIRRVIDVLKKK